MFSKKDLAGAMVLVLIVGLVAYIGYDTWRDYQIRGVQKAYQSGVSDAVKQLLEKSQAAQCKGAVPVTLGDTTVEFVDVKCLQQPAEKEQSAPATTTKK